MWLFYKDGFLSIVEHKDDPDYVMVRSRDGDDINGFVDVLKSLDGPSREYTIKHTPTADYAHRVVVEKTVLAEAVKVIALNINYTNFKSEIHTQHDHDRDTAYMKVWSAMSEFQEYRN